MNKKILFFSFLILAICSVVFKVSVNNETEIDKLRKQHAKILQEHPFQKTGNLPKKKRKAQGLPPNAYFEQKYLSEINPSTGRTHKENVYRLQEELNKRRIGRKVPGDTDNAWVERGPDNVGGRTRALLFDPNDATNETVFAGGVSGGLWKNTNISNSASKWVRVGIPENLAVSCIAVDPNNSKTFYIGTGESYVNGDVNGDGLWKSTDGGNTWNKVLGGVTGETFLDTNSKLTINSPAEIGGDYISVLTTAFGGDITTPITKDLVLVIDGTVPTEDGCDAITNAAELNGKIAVIRRGTCNFSAKAKNAQDAGAVAVIIVNNVSTAPFNMAAGDGAEAVTIPAVMINQEIGDAIITKLSTGSVNGTLTKLKEDATNSTIVPGIQHINDIVIRNNAGVSEVYVAAGEAGYTGGISLGGDSIGVYKSINGTDFTKINLPKTSGGNPYEPNNLEIASDNSIYLSTTRSFTFRDGGGAILKSTDGENFNLVHSIENGLRTEIALSPSNAGTVYVLAEINDSEAPVKILKTLDGFTTVNETALPNDADTDIEANDFTRGQAFYDLLIKVDPNDENILYVGGIDLFKSIDGGETWGQLSHWYGGFGKQYVHADHHGLAFASSNRMVFGNDGGVYFSDNSGITIGERNKNYNTVQFYTVGVAPTTAFGGAEYFLAGAQDNGTRLIKEATEGINSAVKVFGGDGAASFFDTDGTDKYYIVNYVYNQAIELKNLANNQVITINEEDTSNGDFINQEELDSNLNILYSNYSSSTTPVIRRYSNILNEASLEKNLLINSLMNAEPSTLKVSPYTITSSKLFVGLKNGKVLKIEDANTDSQTWSEITGDEFVGSVSDIEFGENENQIFVTMHNYGVKNIWYSNDGGNNWVSKEGNLPDIPVKAILQNPLSTNEVIIGTDLGVWRTSNFNEASPNWTQSYNGMSNVPVLDLDLRDDNVVFAATYGRGIFSGKFILDPNGDADNDGVLNGVDNCPNTANPDQADVDGNGIGDVCQDTDGDGILDINDNCPTKANPDQADADNNGIGDACQDTDGDGVMDNVDNCLTTANADQADGNGDGVGDVCDTSYKNADNISIKTTSETCADENDGKITVNVKQTFLSYTVTVKGTSTDVSEQLTTESITFSNLVPGAYEVCVKVNDRDDYVQCFEVQIKETSPVSLKVAKNNASKGYTINVISGTAPYNVYLNGNLIDTFNNSTFDINVQGSGILEVKTAKECEGRFKTIIDNIFLKKNPVSESIDLLVPNNAASIIEVRVYDVTGKVVLKDKINKQGNELSIPFDKFKSGIYILKLGTDEKNTFKILK
ncbi:thrombospondin type 3 repeat-containing protein [Tenacibaculum singaporense]|uniref:thrombospondin type 3 repeat-containing protein n=1 Tax=Tenacibaculum singaporense TaxID=2358479 RepID=UPI000F68B07A|nr:thrombospondin type 3 repeat-containing protein [Tenacibaculum singaporense]RSC95022.1 T9SS C-terminal target domain-containing protein [Tenacibaculum singaporense]